jgi:Family of unknown function (DUF6084)
VQGFTGVTEVDLALPCTYDFDVTASRYLHSLVDGKVPLCLLFPGTVFIRGTSGFGVQQVPWDCEARYQLPVAEWRRLMDLYFPGTGWIRLGRDVLRDVAAYRTEHGLTTWDETLTALLARDMSTTAAGGAPLVRPDDSGGRS